MTKDQLPEMTSLGYNTSSKQWQNIIFESECWYSSWEKPSHWEHRGSERNRAITLEAILLPSIVGDAIGKGQLDKFRKKQ